MNAESIRILAETDEEVEPRTRPIAPTAGDRVTASLPARATASFSNFVIPGASSSGSSSSRDVNAGPGQSPRLSPPGGSSSGSSTVDGDDMMGVEDTAGKARKVGKKSRRD
jgi:hypothetical protein